MSNEDLWMIRPEPQPDRFFSAVQQQQICQRQLHLDINDNYIYPSIAKNRKNEGVSPSFQNIDIERPN